jgi:hypothetical protein
VLRRWLRGDSPDPVREVDEAMRQVIDLFAAPAPPAGTVSASAVSASTVSASTVSASAVSVGSVSPGSTGTTVAVFSSGQDIDAILPEIRRLLNGASAADRHSRGNAECQPPALPWAHDYSR